MLKNDIIMSSAHIHFMKSEFTVLIYGQKDKSFKIMISKLSFKFTESENILLFELE